MDDDQVPSQRAGEGSGPPRESDSATVKDVSELEVWSAEDQDKQFTERQCQEIIRHKQVPGWQMQKILGMVSNPKLIDTYLRFRQLLGNDVQNSHKKWEELQASNAHPLLKVVGLAFGVISTPGTSSYMKQQWDQLQEHMDPDSPDAIIARAMMDYALAWAYHREDLGKALNIVTAFYEEMESGDSSNFFLAPCYTVTIGRWTYDANRHHLSDKVIEEVKYYAYKTLGQLKSLKDEWAIIDTFGMKLNAMVLLLRVKKYYTDNSLSVENLERDIEDLLGELEGTLSHPKITTYDKAGFYSVSRRIFENVNNEEFCRRAKISAELFRRNGRIRRAVEEAELSGDKELVQELSLFGSKIAEKAKPILGEGGGAGQPLEQRVLMECETRFFKVVAAKDIYRELCRKHVIPQTVVDQITKSHSVGEARGHLFDHMRDYGTLATLKAFCDVITSEEYVGFQAMQDFGSEMKRRLEQGGEQTH